LDALVSTADAQLHGDFKTCACCDRWTPPNSAVECSDASVPHRFFTVLKIPPDADLNESLSAQYDVSGKFSGNGGAQVLDRGRLGAARSPIMSVMMIGISFCCRVVRWITVVATRYHRPADRAGCAGNT